MPLVISNGMVLGEPESASALALDHPRIMYEDLVRDATITPTSEQAGFEAVNVADYLTWDFWKPVTLPASIIIETEEATEIDYALIAAHTLGTCKASVGVDYWNGSAYVELFSTAPGTDKVVVSLFSAVSSNRFRLRLIAGTDPLETLPIPAIGVVMLGKALAVERKLFRGHKPITMSRRTIIRPQSSEGGQWLGRSIQRDGLATDISFQNITGAWMRAKFDPFIISARQYPFGWAWRPADYPAEVAYCWSLADIVPVNTGPRDLMSVSLKVEAIGD